MKVVFQELLGVLIDICHMSSDKHTIRHSHIIWFRYSVILPMCNNQCWLELLLRSKLMMNRCRNLLFSTARLVCPLATGN